MDNIIAYSLGFLSASVLFTAFIVVYYIRAKRRVASIKAAILKFQEASKVVGEAADRAYPKQ